ncbi:efflux RND transporter periplasmic adaptor subunit [Marinifilum sp. D714]|uniref:efflux RND transporter periplasmic adaptor subunit n=1 Tax=Marinifilum sp. D714 TaxID=2937523 RepID=UPI0027C1912F|nr:efflux RND transporter periplasmic adaptor subunit [Marinifilum sp. D714]MDQ2180756.1 efflux RND transporter periplasmic adaptor subunit [Marinifilum sp. D714]
MNIVHKNYISGILIPEKEVELKSQISGILKKMYVKAGDTIKRGDLIAEVSVLPNPQNIETASKTLTTCQINYNKCKKEYEQYKRLFEKKVVAEQEFDKYADAYLISVEELKSAKKQLEIIKTGYSKDQENIPNFIRSTVSGTVLEIPLKEGASITERNNYNEGSNLASIANLQSLIFKAKVNESDISYLKKGMIFNIEISALKNQSIQAELTHITPKAKEENGIMKFDIEAKVRNDNNIQLYPGFSAVAEMILDRRDSVLSIKERNLIFKNDSIYVELLDENFKIQKRVVKPGLSDGIRIEILQGLSSDDKVKVQKN